MRNNSSSAISDLEKLRKSKEKLAPNDDFRRFYFVSPKSSLPTRIERIHLLVNKSRVRITIQTDPEQVNPLLKKIEL